ncbi:hypothetical protein GCM10022252_62280 [Streptosporangium oxazolinicum]|uniref:Uncharacterized protein n=1 Tax=Streptosporangium oxazolinicum TaxID=909287 RepID=A0ABP8BD16_9ACTN
MSLAPCGAFSRRTRRSVGLLTAAMLHVRVASVVAWAGTIPDIPRTAPPNDVLGTNVR